MNNTYTNIQSSISSNSEKKETTEQFYKTSIQLNQAYLL